jgi:5-methyltetrahydropteroyltriglutamate--homocysteine methyltransferase
MPDNDIKTTVVGSYPVPDWLIAAPTEQALIDATRVVVHTQELAGIDLVCDGELSRFNINHPETNGMIEYFVAPLSGVRTALTFEEVTEYRSQEGMGFRTRPPGVVDGPISHGTLDLPKACAQGASVTSKPFKFTLTGPHMLAKTLVDNHYGAIDKLAFAIAEVLAEQVAHLDADVVQVDEANLPGSPQEWEWALEAINHVLKAIKGESGVHLCFGNYGGQHIQSGDWQNLTDYLNGLAADHLVLEAKSRPAEEIHVLKALRPDLKLGIGVIDIKSTEIETADAIAKDVERLVGILGEGRLAYIHPDCGFWMLPRSVADGKIKALVEGRDLYLGREIAQAG